MTGRFTRQLALAGLAALLGVSGARGAAQNTPPVSDALAAQEKEQCKTNLGAIFKAIKAYELDKKELPNWLSDLVPGFLSDPNLLTCPVCRRTGKVETPPLADPKIASSYLYEFCPVPLGGVLPEAPERTRREWKRRQMGMVGSAVPIIRCRHHGTSLNVAFDGTIYEAPAQWELAFTNRVRLEDLSPAKLFANEGAVPPTPKPKAGTRFPARDPKAGPGLIDLTRHYNVALTETWQGKTNQHLGALPRGVQKVGATEFDLRGVVQLGSKSVTNKAFPRQVKNIEIKRKCRELRLLHGARPGAPEDEGKQIGSYFVYFAGNPARLEIPIVYGKDVSGWQPTKGESAAEPKPAWTGETAKNGEPVRLYVTGWTNLLADVVVEKVDFVSAMAGPAPFLVAITAE